MATFLSSKMEQRIQCIIGKAWLKVWLPFLRHSERQVQIFYSPFTFTAQRHKESNYTDRIFLRFEIWGRMTWGIPVSNTQETDFFLILQVKGSESCSIHAVLGIGSSWCMLFTVEKRDAHTCSWLPGASSVSCSHIMTIGFRDFENLFLSRGWPVSVPDAPQDRAGSPGCQGTADSDSTFHQPGPPGPSPQHCFPAPHSPLCLYIQGYPIPGAESITFSCSIS